MKLRSQYNYKHRANSEKAALRTKLPSRTQQNFKDETDINQIVRRLGVTGMLPQRKDTPLSIDFSENAHDFKSANNLIVAAKVSFAGLDAAVRKRFGNDPATMIEFLDNPHNLDEARKLGIILPQKIVTESPPMKVHVVNHKENDSGEESSSGKGTQPSGKSGKDR